LWKAERKQPTYAGPVEVSKVPLLPDEIEMWAKVVQRSGATIE